MISNIINYLILIVFIWTGLAFYKNYALWVLLISTIIMPFISILLFRKYYRNTSFCIRELPKSVGRDVDIVFKLVAENKSFYPLGDIRITLEVKNSFYNNNKLYHINIPSVPFSEKEITWRVKSLYSGYVTINIKEVEVMDFLRIYKKKYETDIKEGMLILPNPGKISVDLKGLAEGEGDEEETQYVKGSDVSDVSEIRKYIAGDSLQSVHWKMSARYDELMVKEYSMPYTNKICLILELYNNEDESGEMDCVIEAFYTYALQLQKLKRQFYLVWNNSAQNENVIREVITEEDILSAMTDIMFVSPSKERITAYNSYINEFKKEYTGLYVTNKSNESYLSLERFDLYNGKAAIYNI